MRHGKGRKWAGNTSIESDVASITMGRASIEAGVVSIETGGASIDTGKVSIKLASELGLSPNHFLNVQNGNPGAGSYKVVRQ